MDESKYHADPVFGTVGHDNRLWLSDCPRCEIQLTSELAVYMSALRDDDLDNYLEYIDRRYEERWSHGSL